jgi:hypothetical protein
VEDMHLCELCREAYEPEEVVPGGIRKLKEFKGYTVDLRLQEFRKVPYDELPEFIAFTSTKGQTLLSEMHEEAVQQARNKLNDLEKRLYISFKELLKRQKQEKVTR